MKLQSADLGLEQEERECNIILQPPGHLAEMPKMTFSPQENYKKEAKMLITIIRI